MFLSNAVAEALTVLFFCKSHDVEKKEKKDLFPKPSLCVPEFLPPLETQQKGWRHLGGEIATS